MISILLASALVAAPVAPAAAAAPAPAAASPPPTSIDSLLEGLSAPGPGADGEDEPDPADAAGSSRPDPIPYPQLEVEAYDRAIRESAAAARARGGPLEGAWMLESDDGKALYRFQFADRGPSAGLAEGAWRDLNGGPRLAGSGFVSLVGYDGGELMLRFYETGPDDLVVVTVKPTTGDGWSGQLRRGGTTTPVQFKRE